MSPWVVVMIAILVWWVEANRLGPLNRDVQRRTRRDCAVAID
jgi:hypothetical protein